MLLITWLPGIRRHHPVSSLIAPLIVATILLYLAERGFSVYAADSFELYQVEAVLLAFKSAWWLVPAVWVSAFLPVLLWRPIERRTGYPVPGVAKTFVNLAIFLFAAFCIMAVVFDRPLTSVWAASGILTVILGIALQSFILDAFSGLMLHLERPFGIGHWIEITSRYHVTEVGRVTELNWRTTRIWTRDNNEVVVPNSAIGTSVLTNYSVPTRPSRLQVPVVLEFNVPVNRAREILLEGARGAIAEDCILAEPPPRVVVEAVAPYGIRYKVQVYQDLETISVDEARTRVVAVLLDQIQSSGLQIALPKEEQIALAPGERDVSSTRVASHAPSVAAGESARRAVLVAPRSPRGLWHSGVRGPARHPNWDVLTENVMVQLPAQLASRRKKSRRKRL